MSFKGLESVRETRKQLKLLILLLLLSNNLFLHTQVESETALLNACSREYNEYPVEKRRQLRQREDKVVSE